MNRYFSAWSEVLGDLREVLIFHPKWRFTSQLLVTSLTSLAHLSTWWEKKGGGQMCTPVPLHFGCGTPVPLSGWPWQGWPLAAGDKGLFQHHISKCIICLRTTLYNMQDPNCLCKITDGLLIPPQQLQGFQLDCHGRHFPHDTEEAIAAAHNGPVTLSVFNTEKHVLPESTSSNLWSDWSSLPASLPLDYWRTPRTCLGLFIPISIIQWRESGHWWLLSTGVWNWSELIWL